VKADPKGIPYTIPLSSGDVYEIYAPDYFDLNNANITQLNFQLKQGQIGNLQPLDSNSYIQGGGMSMKHKQYIQDNMVIGDVTSTLLITNSTFLVIHDQSDFAYYETDGGATDFKLRWFSNPFVTNSKLVCYDAIIGKGIYNKYIFVVCKNTFNNTNPVEAELEIYIFDRFAPINTDFSTNPITSRNFTFDGTNIPFPVDTESLEISFDTITIDNQPHYALIVYSQGRQGKTVDAPAQIVLFDIHGDANSVTVSKLATTNVSLAGNNVINTLYDVFIVEKQLVVTSVNNNTNDKVTMNYGCQFTDLTLAELVCNTTDTNYFTNVDGFISLGHTLEQVVIYNHQVAADNVTLNGQIDVYDMDIAAFKAQNFTNWLNKEQEYTFAVRIGSNDNLAYPRDYTGHESGGAIQFKGIYEDS
jgi:hypothetical protein